jgi:hypothetical protein
LDTGKSNWIADVELAIESLRDVTSARVQVEGDVITEIHVLSRSSRSPKQIVRDVQSVLINLLNRTIDYRKVSVAYLSAESRPATANGRSGASDALASPAPAAEAERIVAEPVRVFAPAPEPEIVAQPRPFDAGQNSERDRQSPVADATILERVRFGGVNLFVSGPRTQAQVELRWRGLPRLGSASGWSTRASVHRLVAEATLAAVQEFLDEELAIAVQDVAILRLGKKRAVVVSLSLLVERREQLLIGSCAVEQDLQQAVVCATLAALNRLVAALRPKPPTEYVLRPTSAK